MLTASFSIFRLKIDTEPQLTNNCYVIFNGSEEWLCRIANDKKAHLLWQIITTQQLSNKNRSKGSYKVSNNTRQSGIFGKTNEATSLPCQNEAISLPCQLVIQIKWSRSRCSWQWSLVVHLSNNTTLHLFLDCWSY